MEATEQIVYSRALSSKQKDRHQGNSTEKIGVPREMKGAALDNFQALFDDYRVHSGDHRTGDTEWYTNKWHWGTIEEYTNEEAEGDHRAGEEDHGGRTGMKEYVGR
jgi:hypothetical protein